MLNMCIYVPGCSWLLPAIISANANNCSAALQTRLWETWRVETCVSRATVVAREIEEYKRPEGQSCFRFHTRPNFPTPITVCPATLSPHSRSPAVFSTPVLLPTFIQMASKAAQKRVSHPCSAGAGFPLITPPHSSVTAVPPPLGL